MSEIRRLQMLIRSTEVNQRLAARSRQPGERGRINFVFLPMLLDELRKGIPEVKSSEEEAAEIEALYSELVAANGQVGVKRPALA